MAPASSLAYFKHLEVQKEAFLMLEHKPESLLLCGETFFYGFLFVQVRKLDQLDQRDQKYLLIFRVYHLFENKPGVARAPALHPKIARGGGSRHGRAAADVEVDALLRDPQDREAPTGGNGGAVVPTQQFLTGLQIRGSKFQRSNSNYC